MIQQKFLFSMPLKWKLVSRYFSGHTKDTNGIAQFKAGKTKVGDAIDGAIKILTVAVCALINSSAIIDACTHIYKFHRLSNEASI